jgi:predicted nucleic acid-binding Zn ribbon protein
MKERTNARPLGSVLDALISALGIGTKLDQYRVFDVWDEVVGEQVAKVARPERLHNGVLTVAVSNAPWRAELTFRKREILEKIRERLASDGITDIRFR